MSFGSLTLHNNLRNIVRFLQLPRAARFAKLQDMAQTKPRIWTANFCLLFAINILVIITYVMLFSTMAYYAVLSFSASDAAAGLTSSMFLVASMAARVLCGRFGETFGLKRVTLASCGLMLFSCVLYLFSASSLALLLVTRTLHGLAFGVAATSVPSLVAKSLPPQAAGVGTGYFMLSNTLGTAIGPWLGLTLANAGHYTALFVISSACAGVSMVASLFIKEVSGKDAAAPSSGAKAAEGIVPPDGDPSPSAQDDSTGRRSQVGAKAAEAAAPQHGGAPRGIASFIDFDTVRFGLFVFLSGFAYSGVSAFLNGYSVEIGLADAAPYAFLLYAVTLMFSRPLAGKLMDTRGENTVILPSFLLMAAGFVIVALVQNVLGMLLVGPLMALGFGSSLSTGAGILARDFNDERITLRMSTFYLLVDAGIGIGPVFLGMAIDALGFVDMYLICGAISLVGMVAYYLLHGRNRT